MIRSDVINKPYIILIYIYKSISNTLSQTVRDTFASYGFPYQYDYFILTVFPCTSKWHFLHKLICFLLFLIIKRLNLSFFLETSAILRIWCISTCEFEPQFKHISLFKVDSDLGAPYYPIIISLGFFILNLWFPLLIL